MWSLQENKNILTCFIDKENFSLVGFHAIPKGQRETSFRSELQILNLFFMIFSHLHTLKKALVIFESSTPVHASHLDFNPKFRQGYRRLDDGLRKKLQYS